MSLKKRLSLRAKRRTISMPFKPDEFANLPAPTDDSSRPFSQAHRQARTSGQLPATLSEGLWAARLSCPVALPPLNHFEPNIFEEMPQSLVLPTIDGVIIGEKTIESPVTALPPVDPENHVLRRTTSSPNIFPLLPSYGDPRRELTWASGSSMTRKSFRLSSITSMLSLSPPHKREKVAASPTRGSLSCASPQDTDKAEAARQLAIEAKREHLLKHARQKSFQKSICKPLPELPEEDHLPAKKPLPKAQHLNHAPKKLKTAQLSPKPADIVNEKSDLPFRRLKSSPTSPLPNNFRAISTPKTPERFSESVKSSSSPSVTRSISDEPRIPSPSPTVPSRSPFRVSPLRIRHQNSEILSQSPRTPTKRRSSSSASIPICIHLQFTYRECRCTLTCLESCSCAIPRFCLDGLKPDKTSGDTDADSKEHTEMKGSTTIITHRREFLDPICHNCLMDEIFGKNEWEWDGHDDSSVPSTPERKVRTIKAWSPKKTPTEKRTTTGSEETAVDEGTQGDWMENLYRDYEADSGPAELDGRPLSIGQQIKSWF